PRPCTSAVGSWGSPSASLTQSKTRGREYDCDTSRSDFSRSLSFVVASDEVRDQTTRRAYARGMLATLDAPECAETSSVYPHRGVRSSCSRGDARNDVLPAVREAGAMVVTTPLPPRDDEIIGRKAGTYLI